MEALGIYNYWIYVAIMMVGFYGVIARGHLVKKVICLSLFQTGVFLFYISMGVVREGVAPIGLEAHVTQVNPIPHVLILTAIVVSVSTSAVALAIVINIQRAYGTVESGALDTLEREEERSRQ